MHYFHQILLRFHYRVDRLVRHRSLVDHIRILPALDASRSLDVVIDSEAPLGLSPRHGPSCSMTATHEALRIPLAAHDVRPRPHAAWNDPHVAFPRPYSSFARDQHVLAIVMLPSHIVVMA